MSQYPQDPSQFPPPSPTPPQPAPPQPSYQDPTTVQPAYQQPAPAQPTYQQPAQPTYQQPAYQQPVQPTYQQPAYTPLPPAPSGGGKASKGGTILVGLVALAVGIGGGYVLGSQTGGSDEEAIELIREENEEVVEELEQQIEDLTEQLAGGGSVEEEPAEEEEEPAAEEEEPAEEEEEGGGEVVSSNEAVQDFCDAVDAFVEDGGNDPELAQELSQQASELATSDLSFDDLQAVGECSARLVSLSPGG